MPYYPWQPSAWSGVPVYFDDGDPGDLRRALYESMLADADLAAIVGARIYPAHAHGRRRAALPADAEVPAITYQVISNVRGMTLAGGNGVAKARVQVDAWSEDPDDCFAIQERLRLMWQGFRGPLRDVTITAAIPYDEFDMTEDPADGSTARHHTAVDWRFIYRERVPTF